MGWIARYTNWLHTRWPAGGVERLPDVRPDGTTNVSGLYVVGDLTGIPLLKFSADTGARAVRTILADADVVAGRDRDDGVLDLVIIGGGVSGMAAALEAKKAALDFRIYEASEPFSTIANFPKGKPIYTYPTDMTPAGDLQFSAGADVKESLLAELDAQMRGAAIEPTIARIESIAKKGGTFEVAVAGEEPVRARRVIVAIGRSGNFRKLGVPGEDLDKVVNRLHDPRDYAEKDVLVVGGGDSALEAAIALATCGANVTLSYRKPDFSRPKPENVEKIEALQADPNADVAVEEPTSERVTTSTGRFLTEDLRSGTLRLMMPSNPVSISEDEVVVRDEAGEERSFANDAVFAMIGREAPLEFFRRSGVKIRGEWRVATWVSFILVVLASVFVYHWKKSGVFLPINETFAENGWFPFGVPAWWEGLGGAFSRPTHLLGTLKISVGEPGFYYSFAYCLAVLGFGIARVRRRKTRYVAIQTAVLNLIQWIPLFLVPYILLPWMGNNGWFDAGLAKSFADEFFPIVGYGHGREYWRAFGFVLAWPLFFWNVFTDQPMTGWLVVSLVQTFVLIPWLVIKFGKGAYCSWICSCGALAETMGDAHRHKMPHGPLWNRLNMIGQVFLFTAFALLVFRSVSWVLPDSVFGTLFDYLFKKIPALNYVWFVDLLWAGIIGVGFYWHFSGRVWCRFACPLAALMHIYARFSRFRILVEKKKCISCNVCTSVCHQGIDVMNFANKGRHMEDPECVRCSACVQMCPTGVLEFGQVDPATGQQTARDPAWLAASPVRSRGS